MKKKISKLRLSRETVRSLNQGNLGQVAGGTNYCATDPSNCIGCYPTIWSECVSGCIVCPDTGGNSLNCSIYC